MGPSPFGIWTTSAACRVGSGSRTKIQRPLCQRRFGDPNPGTQTSCRPNCPRRDMKALKKELRRGVLQLVKKLTAEEIAEECMFPDVFLVVYLALAANRCATNLFQLPVFLQSRNVSIYVSMPTGELQTASIIDKCFQLGSIPH